MLDLIFVATGAAFCMSVSSTPSPAIVCRTEPMILDYVLGGLVTVFLLAYLVVALLKPERF